MAETQIKEKIIKALSGIDREGMDGLLEYMEDEGFFTAPCSGGFHLAKPGGLAEHSLNVLEYADKLASKWMKPKEYKAIYPSLVLAALLHDLGKMGQFGKPNYTPNTLKSGEPAKKPFSTNKDLLPVDHEVRSIAIASMFIDLEEEEQFAILYHNGLYGSFKYIIQGKETPLYMIIHFADMWASRVVEV